MQAFTQLASLLKLVQFVSIFYFYLASTPRESLLWGGRAFEPWLLALAALLFAAGQILNVAVFKAIGERARVAQLCACVFAMRAREP